MTPVKVAPAVSASGPVKSPLVLSFMAARRAATPLVFIETPDAAATIATIRTALGNGTTKVPILSWDCVKGLRGLNDHGTAAMTKALNNRDQAETINVVEALVICDALPELSVVFFHNFHIPVREINVIQATWNLRDTFKQNKRMLVGLGPAFNPPIELAGDVTLLDEPLPTRDELSAVIDQQHQNADLELPKDDVRKAALDALVGLPYFTAEQDTAMSLTKNGLDVPKLWNHKVKSIEGTEGLRVFPVSGSSLDDMKGIGSVVKFFRRLIQADAFGAVVFIDEGDKKLAGGLSDHTGDSGVGKDQIEQLLTYIEDRKALGVLLAGLAGTGKTELAKAVAAASGKPLIVFDMGGMKGGVVGESERKIRAALKVVTATAEGRVLFIMTANKTTMFSPELNRRFPDQYFFDLPDDEGRSAIWPVYVKRNNLTKSQAEFPAGLDKGWTGAEIRRACERAALFGCPVAEAMESIVPSVVSAARTIDGLRRDAAGRFLSASYSGYYHLPATVEAPVAKTSGQRVVEVE